MSTLFDVPLDVLEHHIFPRLHQLDQLCLRLASKRASELVLARGLQEFHGVVSGTSPDDAHHLGAQLRRLRDLRLRGKATVLNASVLVEALPHPHLLLALLLDGTNSESPLIVNGFFFELLPRLEELSVVACQLPVIAWEGLGRLRGLRSLRLQKCPVMSLSQMCETLGAALHKQLVRLRVRDCHDMGLHMGLLQWEDAAMLANALSDECEEFDVPVEVPGEGRDQMLALLPAGLKKFVVRQKRILCDSLLTA